MKTITRYQDKLSDHEARLQSKAVRYVSLAPHREAPTPLSRLLTGLEPALGGEASIRAFVDGLIDITESILEITIRTTYFGISTAWPPHLPRQTRHPRCGG